MRTVPVDATAKALAPEHKLHAALGAQFKKRRGDGAPEIEAGPDVPAWDAAFYGLDRAGLFGSSSEAEQDAILRGCAESLIGEAYGVEKLGMASSAKVVLLSETTEERMAYCLIGSDEAAHLHAITPFVTSLEGAGTGPFFDLLHGAIAELSKDALVFVLQSVLEGWGLSHYRSLAEGCRVPSLGGVLRRILADEAFHVGTGNVLFDPARFSARDLDAATEVLARLFGLVSVGPQSVVAAVERVRGGLTLSERTALFRDLECERTSAERLGLLADLVAPHAELAGRLEALGAFRAQPPEVCASAASRT